MRPHDILNYLVKILLGIICSNVQSVQPVKQHIVINDGSDIANEFEPHFV